MANERLRFLPFEVLGSVAHSCFWFTRQGR